MLTMAVPWLSTCASTSGTRSADQKASASTPSVATPESGAALTAALKAFEDVLCPGGCSARAPTVVVLPPLSPRQEVTRRSRILAEQMVTGLAASGRLRVIDRDRLDLLLDEHQLQYGGLFDESTLPAVGKLLGADSFIIGRYFDGPDGIRLYLRSVAADTGLITSSEFVLLRDDPVPTISSKTDVAALAAQLAAEIASQIKPAPGKRPLVAVLSFPSIDGEPTLLEDDLRDALEIGLAQGSSFSVVSRSSLSKVLAEQQLQTSGRFSEAALASIGKLSGAAYVVSGSMFKIGFLLVIHARLLDTSTGRALAAAALAFPAEPATWTRFASKRLEKTFQNFPEALVRPAGTAFLLSGAEYPEGSMVPALSPTTQVVPTEQGPALVEARKGVAHLKPFIASTPLVFEVALAGGETWRNGGLSLVVDVDSAKGSARLLSVNLGCHAVEGFNLICRVETSGSAIHRGRQNVAELRFDRGGPELAPYYVQLWIGAKEVRLNVFSSLRGKEENHYQYRVLELTRGLGPGPHTYATGLQSSRPMLFARAVGGLK